MKDYTAFSRISRHRHGSFKLCLLAALALPACVADGLDGNGYRSTELREPAGFTRIHSDASLDVEIFQADSHSVAVSIDENLLHLVETRTRDNTLYIEVDGSMGDTLAGPHVLIGMPELHGAKLAGAGHVTAAFDQPDVSVELILSGSGEMSFEGRAAALGAYLSGSGDMRLAGETADVTFDLGGSGRIRGRNLVASTGDVGLSGSGEISANIESSVRVSLTGAGRIDLYGGAEVERASESGSGQIVRH